MARDNAIEFTENKYATRKEMGNELYIQVPDDMWKKILEYRKPFYNVLTLKNYSGSNLYICLYPTFSSKSNQIDAKLLKLLKEYALLSNTSREKEYFALSLMTNCLLRVALYHEMSDIDEARIKKLLLSENPYDENETLLLNYYYALKYVEERHSSNIDIDFLADLYSKVTGNDELTYFYRDSDIDDSFSKSLVSRSFTSAPFAQIEPMMENLFAFIASSPLSNLNKAIITYFYTLFVKPFKDYNFEIASLLAKAVLSKGQVKEFASYLPLEDIYEDKKDSLRRTIQEIVNSGDITYFVSPAMFNFDKRIDFILDSVKDYQVDELRHDFYKEDKEEPAPKVEEKVVEPLIDEPVEQKIERVEEPVKVEPAPKQEVQKTVIEEKVEVPSSNEEDDNEEAEIAFSYIPEKIDEAKAKRLEEHLLELDMRLSKKQAYFYARHCTLGKYYSIEQYKKACKCVYETARKGMEELTNYGYYKKIKVRKKFLYTPVRK